MQKCIFLSILLEECNIGSASTKDYIKFLDFRFCFLFWQSIWLNYSVIQVFQDRNQISNQLKLSWNTWCDSSHSSPTFPLLPRGGSREGCAGLFQLTVGCFHTFGFSFNPSFSEWYLVLQRLKRGRINFSMFMFSESDSIMLSLVW